MSGGRIWGLLPALLLSAAAGGTVEAGGDVIRLGTPSSDASATGTEPVEVNAPRRGFDYDRFVARVESLWFQRKTLLKSGREEDARNQLEEIRAFCSQEGVRRLEHLAGALVSEAYRYHEEGNDRQALSALEFAEAFDPERPQVHVARASVLWGSGGKVAALRELVRAVGASASRSFQDLSLLPRLVFVLGLAWVAAAVIFAVVMLLRYQATLRHELEEWSGDFFDEPWPRVIGWACLALPLMIWAGAGWAPLVWVALTFRFMTRSERAATATLLLVGTLTIPVYRVAVGLYGTSADPAVRTTVAAVEGEYDPDRVVRLRQLVEAHPEDPAYRFLLAGLYQSGRYFEEAFDEYKAVLDLDPSFIAARINVGNIFYTTRQYPAAIKNYHRALELDPDSFLAHFNLHLAQSENFHFKEAEQSLRRAREIDADRVASLLGGSSGVEGRATIQDASLRMVSVWEAAVGGRSPDAARHAAVGSSFFAGGGLMNPVAILCLVALAASGLLWVLGGGRPASRRCIRCGRPFCHRCKSGREAQEYCSQCLHLYVLRDGLEPETKARKLYEVRAYETRTRRVRGLFSILLPGSGQLFRGKTARGLLMLFAWFALLVAAVPQMASLGSDPGVSLSTDLLAAPEVPVRFEPHTGRYLAAFLLPVVWISANWPSRRREK